MVGGFVGGTMVASDRRTAGAQLEDQGIEVRASTRIREQIGSGVHINVTSYNRQVLLTGEVSKAQEKQLAEQILNRVENVRSVVNELAVAPNSSLSERSNDALISGKVKASMIDSRDVFASAFKVVTERGTVYLMGRVTQREATRAVEIARGVSGVQKIIRVFEIITEEELKTLQPPPVNEPAAAAPASKP
jgi:osmotically-inducible protein OsmY